MKINGCGRCRHGRERLGRSFGRSTRGLSVGQTVYGANRASRPHRRLDSRRRRISLSAPSAISPHTRAISSGCGCPPRAAMPARAAVKHRTQSSSSSGRIVVSAIVYSPILQIERAVQAVLKHETAIRSPLAAHRAVSIRSRNGICVSMYTPPCTVFQSERTRDSQHECGDVPSRAADTLPFAVP
jgi:hypothetical protein